MTRKTTLAEQYAARAGATDYAIMLARTKARNRGATPAEVQRNVALFETVQS